MPTDDPKGTHKADDEPTLLEAHAFQLIALDPRTLEAWQAARAEEAGLTAEQLAALAEVRQKRLGTDRVARKPR